MTFTSPSGIEPFGLLCVATYLNEKGKDVELLDMNAADIDYDELPQVIKGKKPDIVGVPSSMTCYIPNAFNVCKIAKSVDPNIITLGGGINFTAATEFYMRRCPELDFVVRGDGEHTAVEFLQALENGDRDFHKIKGLAWRDGEEIFMNPEHIIDDMDSLPFPNWSLVDLDKYYLAIFPPYWGKQVVLTLSRGCPYSCNYCVATRGQGRYRYPSAEWAVESIAHVRYKYGVKMLWINDLCFGVDDKWSEEFFSGLIDRNIDVNICIDMRTDQVIRQKHLLPLMKKAGVRIICCGVESPLEKDEERYAKKAGGNSPAGMAGEANRLAKKAGIERWNFFMIGAPYHTPEDIAEIYRYANKLDAEYAVFAITTPLPGTPFYEETKDLLLSDEVALLSEVQPITKNPYMTPEEQSLLYSEIWVAYYVNPWRAIRRLFSRGCGGWFYRRLYGRYRTYGSMRRHSGRGVFWPSSVEEEKRLRTWAKKKLGAGPIRRAVQFILYRAFHLLRRGGKAYVPKKVG
jgi:anaerobic magnesium-protoporphyrin IX monomethyl ester cyclase